MTTQPLKVTVVESDGNGPTHEPLTIADIKAMATAAAEVTGYRLRISSKTHDVRALMDFLPNCPEIILWLIGLIEAQEKEQSQNG